MRTVKGTDKKTSGGKNHDCLRLRPVHHPRRRSFHRCRLVPLTVILDEALAAAREAIEGGADADFVEVLKYNTDSDMPAWNAPITFDAEGAAWSEDTEALEEMGCITGRF